MKLTVVILGIIWYSYIIIKCNQCWKALFQDELEFEETQYLF